MQVQPNSGTSKATTTTFKPGDEVTFCIVRSRKRTTRISVKEAKVVSMNGPVATVCFRNGRKMLIHQSRLTPASEKNALTKALGELCQ